MTNPDLAAWARLREPAIAAFVAAHEDADIPALALRGSPDAAWPWPLVLDQIAARRKARRKMSAWLTIPGIILPPAALIEQASSAAAAGYKASIVQGRRFADLTAGSGSDCQALRAVFDDAIAVEADPVTAAALAHNLPLLVGAGCAVWPMTAEHALDLLPPCDLIYLDPQRRNDARRGFFRLEDCVPDVLALKTRLLDKAGTVLLKTSPMLDIDSALRALGNVVSVHVVEWRGECREVLYLLRRTAPAPGDVPIHAVLLDDDGSARHMHVSTRAVDRMTPVAYALPDAYLFEPGPASQKAAAFHTLALRYGLGKLHPNTHLFTGPRPLTDFPGRVFRVEGVYGASGKDLPLRKASLTVRNFPMAAESLRRKLGLADGGDDTLFACTLADGKKALIHARKA